MQEEEQEREPLFSGLGGRSLPGALAHGRALADKANPYANPYGDDWSVISEVDDYSQNGIDVEMEMGNIEGTEELAVAFGRLKEMKMVGLITPEEEYRRKLFLKQCSSSSNEDSGYDSDDGYDSSFMPYYEALQVIVSCFRRFFQILVSLCRLLFSCLKTANKANIRK